MALPVAEVRAALDEGDDAVRQGAIARLDLTEVGAVALLLRAMADQSWRVRREAVERASSGKIEPAVILAALVPALGEPEDVGLRNAAIEAVVAIGAASVDALHKDLASRPAHRKVLCDVLGRLKQSSSTLPLASMLDDEDPNVRIAAAEAIGHLPIGDDEGGQQLAKALDALVVHPSGGSERALLGTALLEAIARRRMELSVAVLGRLLEEPVLGASALRALANGAAPLDLAQRAACRALAEAQLANGSRAIRESALLAVAHLAVADSEAVKLSPATTAYAIEALLEGTVDVQRAAAILLGQSDVASAARPLLVAIEDSLLAESAGAALSRLARSVTADLIGVAASVTPAARAALYRAIGRAFSPTHRWPRSLAGAPVQALVDAASNEDERVALAALDALAVVDDDAAVDALAAVIDAGLTDTDPTAADRVDAARRSLRMLATLRPERVLSIVRPRTDSPFMLLLGQVGDATDAEALIVRVSDPDADARAAATTALAELAARRNLALDDALLGRASEAVRVALVDEAPTVRAAAARALALIEARRPSGTHVTIDGLLLGARDEDARVRGAAVRALIEVLVDPHERAPESTASLMRGLRTLADGHDDLTAIPALEALATLDDPGDDARLVDALTGTERERRKVALYGLAKRPRLLLRGDLMRVVDRALHDEAWDLRRAATAALAAAGEIARPALSARRSIESDPLVRADLDRALETLRRG